MTEIVRGIVEIATGVYGKNWDSVGVLAEQLARVEVGIRQLPGGTWIYVQPDGSTAKVLCSELVKVWTEDGPCSGRCGQPVSAERFACEAHAAEINEWLAQSEAEAKQWERAVEPW